MNVIYAIARQMVAECVRMKIALVFLVLLGAVLLALPMSIEGDRSLTGKVQAFTSYALLATGTLLGILTVFLARSMSDDFVNRQILMVMSKPVPRWKYVVGKWVGATVLNAAFLGFCGLSVYAMVHFIIATNEPIDEFDETELRHQVMVARHSRQVVLPDFAKTAERELEQRLEEGFYDGALDYSRAQALDSLTKKHEYQWRTVGPFDERVFLFDGILCDRSPEAEVQIRYKTNVTNYAPDEIFRAKWVFGDRRKGTPLYEVKVRHVIGRYHTIRIPADAVADDQTLRAHFYNRNEFPEETQAYNVIQFLPHDGIEVRFVVGSFEGNLLRLLVLMQCKLMFLAAVALLMTTVFSFPVACLVSFTVYALAGLRSFIVEALDMASKDWAGWFESPREFAVHLITWAYAVPLSALIPDFSYFDGVESFVNGQNVGLVWVLQGVAELGLRTLVVLGLAILFFQRREVSEVSV